MPDHFRHELKFVCTVAELAIIESRLRAVMHPDPHADAEGRYRIRSIYFDDIHKTCYYDNENGIDPRVKFRIRIYNRSPERILLERKIKQRSLTGKDFCLLKRDECEALIAGRVFMDLPEEAICGLHGDFLREYEGRHMRPVVLIEYERKPYIYPHGNVRVTFDMDISASHCVGRLFDDNISRVFFLPQGQHVMEVKYDDYLPDEIAGIVNYPHLRRGAFSKFYLGCRAIEGRLQDELW